MAGTRSWGTTLGACLCKYGNPRFPITVDFLGTCLCNWGDVPENRDVLEFKWGNLGRCSWGLSGPILLHALGMGILERTGLGPWKCLPGAGGEHGDLWAACALPLKGNRCMLQNCGTNPCHLCCGHKFWLSVTWQGAWMSVYMVLCLLKNVYILSNIFVCLLQMIIHFKNMLSTIFHLHINVLKNNHISWDRMSR